MKTIAFVCSYLLRYSIRIFQIFHLNSIGYLLYRIRCKLIISYLSNDCRDILYAFKKATTNANFSPLEDTKNLPIFIFWYQGINTAPQIVKKCVESIRKNANTHPVCMLDKDNLSRYIEIPQYIQTLVDEGRITLTHYSDIVRVKLLRKYGGLWMDSTLFCVSAIPERYFTLPYFCGAKLEKPLDKWHLSDYKWSVSFMGSCYKESRIFSFLDDCFMTYWRKNNKLIDYFLVDFFVYIAKQELIDISKQMMESPFCEQHMYDLQTLLNQPFDEKIFLEYKVTNCCFKVSYKLKEHNEICNKKLFKEVLFEQ